MDPQPPLLVFLDLAGVFVFAVNGAMTAIRATRLDIVGVVTLGMLTGLGGGTIRDILLDALPPAAFVDWRYLVTAAGGGLVAFALSQRLDRLGRPIVVLDAIGLSVFAVIGASKAVALDFGYLQAVLVGVITACGGGTLRDVMILRVPTVLRSELYAIPALVAATITVGLLHLDIYSLWAALGAAAACFLIRIVGLRYDLNAPEPPYHHRRSRERE
ncbi:trimeric intracellular cation channel family protein [Ornithinimicrobium sufpigmenti]|uniref:trimeric intracellular cation channel family protein n=1 Tax=Ornithinimicrobium sufpigmenti TaxID=2508882 RepID=UPI0010358299|nr:MULTISPECIES: trimeric intracellular cation channel family protein [unclassified Ornithinimicrobium]